VSALLEVSDLDVGYGRVGVLNRVTLNVPRGAIVVLLGGNGAGKTTLLRALSGIVKPRGGAIAFDGAPIAGLKPRAIVSRGLVQVPQGRFVWQGMTVLDNLLLGAVTRSDKAEIRASVADAFTLFPTLQRRQADRAGQLSGGEQQMLAVARALMAKPRMLLMDEPSAGLSPRILGEMVEALRALHARGLGMLLVEQNVGLAGALADTAYVLANGTIAFETDGASLVSNPRIIASYLGQ
jgi:branched-chain amino acid transport system ATP-binding protein